MQKPSYHRLTEAGAKLVPVDRYGSQNVSLFLIVSGTSVATVEYTGDNIQAPGYDPGNGNWFTVTNMDDASASAHEVLNFPVTAVRLTVDSTDAFVELQVVPGR